MPFRRTAKTPYKKLGGETRTRAIRSAYHDVSLLSGKKGGAPITVAHRDENSACEIRHIIATIDQ